MKLPVELAPRGYIKRLCMALNISHSFAMNEVQHGTMVQTRDKSFQALCAFRQSTLITVAVTGSSSATDQHPAQ